MKRIGFDKIAFVLSAATLAFLYGVAAGAFGWFPSSYLRMAWNQAEALTPLDTKFFTRAQPPQWRWLTGRVFERSGTRILEPDRAAPGLILITATGKSDQAWLPGAKLIDRQGRVLHEWRLKPRQLFPAPPADRTSVDPEEAHIHGAYLFPNGDLLVNLSYVGTARVDACGEPVWTLPFGGHHSISRAEDGTFWIVAGSWDPPQNQNLWDPSSLPERTYYDRFLHVSDTGELLKEIDLLTVLFRNGLQRYIPKGSGYPPELAPADVTHANDVEPLSAAMAGDYPLFEAGDVVVSVHELDLVFVFDPETLNVKWYTSDPFIQQHDPDFIGNGWIGVFDNNRDGTDRGSLLGGSRVVALQPHTDSMEILFPSDQSESFYTPVMGKWQKLGNGNLLLTESKAGRILEVMPDGSTAWEWVTGPYDDQRIPVVTEGSLYPLTVQNVAEWQCAD